MVRCFPPFDRLSKRVTRAAGRKPDSVPLRCGREDQYLFRTRRAHRLRGSCSGERKERARLALQSAGGGGSKEERGGNNMDKVMVDDEVLAALLYQTRL